MKTGIPSLKIAVVATALSLPLMAGTAAAGDAAAGKAKAATCFACHGVDGIGTADIYPNLAGQKAAYLVSSAKAYKTGDRKGGMSAVMTPMIATVSDADLADIAAYYASLGSK